MSPGTKNTDQSFFNRISEDVWAAVISGILITAALFIAFAWPSFRFPAAVYQWTSPRELMDKVLTPANLLFPLLAGVVFALLSSIAVFFLKGRIRRYLAGFLFIYLLAVISLILAGNKNASYYGVEYVVFALLTGLLISNLFTLPAWIKEAARSEFFIKTGLVILGTSILFTDVVKAGLPGLLQALAVVAVVWFFAIWLSRKLNVDDEFAVILASAVSICGVSAAIVASGAIGGDKRKLSYVTTLVLLVAIPMMILQPWIIRNFGIPELVGGAWLGGTLDTTASVTAASQLVGPVATKAGVIVKFSQNVLIGFAAFFISAWWIIKKKQTQNSESGPRLKIIWERFPKFVIGFMAASLIFSFAVPEQTTKQISGVLNGLRTLWFALAFVSIGLEARFSDLVKMERGRPALAFIGAQVFNLVWTLLLAYLLFGGILFAPPDIK
ncbi:putative sulfate exporter family transporter [Terrimonas sp. NA20]|uniref:Sulfate exporter family transporter n=1 Tax=Terrimonas ginsenosidimutans TaxID=2908004 RepID=A0ABS9KLS0_9BACT|nr:putative sulfate exporter family transporter [Terrimonas ginsenosidimutans]MCG2613267.1 putative sulfate exporter family transporter [Terrimonas ginsenosidimutans]